MNTQTVAIPNWNQIAIWSGLAILVLTTGVVGAKYFENRNAAFTSPPSTDISGVYDRGHLECFDPTLSKVTTTVEFAKTQKATIVITGNQYEIVYERADGSCRTKENGEFVFNEAAHTLRLKNIRREVLPGPTCDLLFNHEQIPPRVVPDIISLTTSSRSPSDIDLLGFYEAETGRLWVQTILFRQSGAVGNPCFWLNQRRLD